MADHERRCFVARSGLPEANVVPHDLCQGPPSLELLSTFDAVTVGGAGDYYVSKENLPHFREFLDFLREVVARGHPTFASCFGYQCLVLALGGEVIHDPDRCEVGTYELTLTEEGAADALMSVLPERFNAQLGHKDRASRAPDGIVNLASSPLSPFQALRIPDQPIWATQFHPELDRETNLDRFRHYLEGYATVMDKADAARAMERFRESPETSTLLRWFFDLVF